MTKVYEAEPEVTVNQPFYSHFFGLRRSGNHAVINWMSDGLRHDGAIPIHFNSVAGFQRAERATDNMRARILEKAATQVIISYEDVQYLTRESVQQYREFSKTRKRDIVLLRSFPNLVASRFQRMRNLEKEGQFESVHHKLGWTAVSDLWVEYAQQIVDQPSATDFVGILYDSWHSDVNYRDEIAKKLGFNNQDFGVDFVPPNARGSSFDGFLYQNSGSQMATLKRWELVYSDLEARRILQDHFTGTVAELNGELFGYSELD